MQTCHASLHIRINRTLLEELSRGEQELKFIDNNTIIQDSVFSNGLDFGYDYFFDYCDQDASGCTFIEGEFYSKDTQPGPDEKYVYQFETKDLILQDVKKHKWMNFMPGFKVTWYYSGLEVKPVAKYFNDTSTRSFVRYPCIFIFIHT